MLYFQSNPKHQKGMVHALVLIIFLIITIIASVYLVTNFRTIFKSKASNDQISVVTGVHALKDTSGKVTTTSPKVDLDITSPLAPPDTSVSGSITTTQNPCAITTSGECKITVSFTASQDAALCIPSAADQNGAASLQQGAIGKTGQTTLTLTPSHNEIITILKLNNCSGPTLDKVILASTGQVYQGQ